MFIEILRRQIKTSEVIAPIAALLLVISIITGIVDWNTLFFMFCLFLSFLLIMNLAWKRIGLTEITIDKEFLTITNYFILKGSSRKFLINEISKLRVLKNEKGENYTSKGQISILGFRHTPEKWKDYEIVPTMIRFTYRHKEMKFGEGYKKFNAKKIVETILDNQKITKPNPQ